MRAIAIAAAASVFSVGLTLPAHAQEDGDVVSDDIDESAPADDVGFGGGETSAPRDSGNVPAAAPESYVVQPGDTLWNLSQRFLNNPWYWPKVWAINQQLDNPNWIYPGSQIRFYGQSQALPPPEPEQDDVPDFEDVVGGGFEGDDAVDRFRDVGNTRRRRSFFVPNEKLNEAGRILNSPEEKQLLANLDRTYVKLDKSHQPGDVLQIFRPSREIVHPVTGASLGRMVEMIGEVRVDLLSKEQALGTIMRSWEAIERGDYVAELPVETEPVRSVENTKSVKAYVVDSGLVELSYVGENYTVIVDKGSNDGVQVGNSFIVVRAGDPYTKEYAGLADEDIGEVLIVETSKSVSTGLLIHASREIVPGDRAEMRAR